MGLSGSVMNYRRVNNQLEVNISETGASIMFEKSLILTVAAGKLILPFLFSSFSNMNNADTTTDTPDHCSWNR